MKTLLQTMAAVMLAATMAPMYADEPTVHVTIEQQENKEAVDSAAAWAHGIVRSLGVGGALAAGFVASAALGNGIPVLLSIPCTWIWAYFMDTGDHIFNMNWETKQRADMINGRLSHAMMAVGLVTAIGVAGIQKSTIPLS